MRFIFPSAKSLIFILGSATAVLADPPQEPKPAQYSKLWVNSPFTIKPEIKPTPKESPLERDWMLGSIRPSGEEYAVTLINKKDRKDRVRFLPGFPTKEYKLLKVQQDSGDPKKSRVQIQKGSQTAWISYDLELAKVRTAAVKKPTQQQNKARSTNSNATRPPIPGRATNANQGSSNQGNSSSRTRSVPRRSSNGR